MDMMKKGILGFKTKFFSLLCLTSAANKNGNVEVGSVN